MKTEAQFASGDDSVVTQIDGLIRGRFYSPELLEQVGWANQVQAARAALRRSPSDAEREEILRHLVAGLRTSHTEYFPRTDPRYWELAAIFEDMLAEDNEHCPDRTRTLPALPLQRDDIGVAWKRIDGRWFIAGVFDDGAAHEVGLVVGDEVVLADGKPFNPVVSFERKSARNVRLTYRRTAAGVTSSVDVKPRTSRPQVAYLEALTASAKIINSGTARIAYVRVWSWAAEGAHEELKNAISKLNESQPTGFILDLRDGWGGAAPNYVDIFQKEVPVQVSRSRDGRTYRYDTQIRVPTIVLINRGSRSGKETIAFAVKRYHLARLVGERTAGAALPGTVYCLNDGGLLFVATGTNTLDGVNLEGIGVEPDIEVPFDVRHAGGRDPQLEKALQLLSEPT